MLFAIKGFIQNATHVIRMSWTQLLNVMSIYVFQSILKLFLLQL